MSDNSDAQSTQAEIDHHLMMMFSRTLDLSKLPPMTVMRMMAATIGAIYRQCADAHLLENCPCGWQPVSSDIATLQSEMEMSARQQLNLDLPNMPVVGRA